MLEAYQAYADYTTMLDLIRDLVQHAAIAAHGRPVAIRPDGEHDLSGHWPVIGVYEAVAAVLGADVDPDTTDADLHRLLTGAGLTGHDELGHGGPDPWPPTTAWSSRARSARRSTRTSRPRRPR